MHGLRWAESLDANDDRPGHEHVAVISDASVAFSIRFDPHVTGRQIQLNRGNYTVVGVMPKDFGYPFDGDVPYDSTGFKQADLWLPAAYTNSQKTNRVNFASGAAIGRLRDGVSKTAAESELKAIQARLDPLYPEMWRGWTVLVRPLVQTIIGPVEKMLWLLLGAVGIVLLIAISNVAHLVAGACHRAGSRVGHPHRSRRRARTDHSPTPDGIVASELRRRRTGHRVCLRCRAPVGPPESRRYSPI